MRVTIYSQYFNPAISRKQGRRIRKVDPKAFSHEAVGEILRSYNIRYESRECRYPRVPWQKSILYSFESDLKKITILKMIEKKLSR